MVKVAVATSDGVSINEHFGQAVAFHLFAVEDDGTFQSLEVRAIKNAPRDQARTRSAETTVEQLRDVEVVLANQIGPGAAANLSGRGIKSFAVRGRIDRVLTAFGKRHQLLEVEIPGVTRCRPSAPSCGCARQECK
jgi:nitrogen fixation protein NifX